MKETCLKCHIDTYYQESVVQATWSKLPSRNAALRKEGLLTPEPFDEAIEFL